MQSMACNLFWPVMLQCSWQCYESVNVFFYRLILNMQSMACNLFWPIMLQCCMQRYVSVNVFLSLDIKHAVYGL